MNVAVLGCGSIVPDFLEAVRSIGPLDVTTILGREASREKVTRFAKDHRIDQMYFDYDELLADESVDMVYVALPNNLHYEYGKKALEHGKHVIMEKPFTGNLSEAEDLIDTAGREHLMIFEAISNQYLPSYQETKKLLPRLGSIKLVELNFSQYSHRYDSFKTGVIHPVFDPEKQGGVLMDLNVYNIYFMMGLFGRPTAVHYYANIQRGIDTSGILIMEYPTFIGCCTGAKDCAAPFSVAIEGDEGCIYSNESPSIYSTFSFKPTGEDAEEFSLNHDHHRMYYELRAFSDMLLSEDYEAAEKANLQTLAVMEILDEARRQIGILQP